jgi:hypothetical protein
VTPQEAAAEWSDLAKESAARAANEAPLGALTVEALYDRLREAEATVRDIEAEISDRQGDETCAAWHRCRARATRTQDPQDKARAVAAFQHHMAARHLREGTRPKPGEVDEAEILEAMLRIAP